MDHIIINEKDNVCVALKDLKKGETVEAFGGKVTLLEDVNRGHKIALKDLKKGENVIKYGSPIGHVTCDVPAGSHIHIHNLKTNLGEVLEYTYHPENAGEEMGCRKASEFMGFKRTDGSVGVRNEIWILPTVGCVNSIAAKLAENGRRKLKGSVEDVLAFAHPYGCSQMGEDQEATRTILADLIRHPNAGGVLVLGLGCENSNIGVLKGYLGGYDESRVKFLQCQDVEDEIEEGGKLIEELIEHACGFKRETCSADKLVIGLKCGGSDGLSGITANPTVGLFSDILCSMGGTTILTEVPEMFGAETMLMDRCETPELFDKTVCLINNFKEYYIENHQTIYENPSPGNKAGGISTLEDKSLGCTQKSGKAKVRGVLEYGERVKDKGLNLLSAPGNDLVAATALAAAGAQIVLFTTGRGTPFASPVPTVKISTNSALYGKKEKWIDFNCGVLTEGKDMTELSEELFAFVTEVASGKKIKSEIAGYHDLAIFKRGVTL
ncbi:MAG: altronate dehydratase family protein [Lachnospiraceae bacterium]|nr:altronate dehydratase family protein [Lachnospiraceae bacterium]